MERINVVGTSGSGKSTVARAISEKLGYPYVEFDALYWGKNWSEPSDEILFNRLRQALDCENWVLDGNYSRSIPIKWARVTHVVWVDYSITRTLAQAISRAFVRSYRRQELWTGTGNRESFRKSFMSRDSIILWTLKTYRKNRHQYEMLMQDPKYLHVNFIRLRSRRETRQFLESISSR